LTIFSKGKSEGLELLRIAIEKAFSGTQARFNYLQLQGRNDYFHCRCQISMTNIVADLKINWRGYLSDDIS
jgi:hypothetical protein